MCCAMERVRCAVRWPAFCDRTCALCDRGTLDYITHLNFWDQIRTVETILYMVIRVDPS